MRSFFPYSSILIGVADYVVPVELGSLMLLTAERRMHLPSDLRIFALVSERDGSPR